MERTVELAEEVIANLGPGVDHRVLSAGHIVMGKKRTEHRPVVTNRPTCARVEL